MKRNVILVLVILSISAVLFAQYSLNMFEPEIIDARAEALGRTSILSSTGANYIFNNPAMLSNFTTKNIQLSCITKFGQSVKKYDVFGNNGRDVIDYLFHMKLHGIAFSIPYLTTNSEDLKLGFGAGYRTYYDFGYNKHYKIDNHNYDYDYISHGGFNVIVLGGGLNYQDSFYAGLSISFPSSSFFSTEYENSDDYEYETEGIMKGSFLTFSGAYHFNEIITCGFRLRNGFILKVEEEYQDNEGYEYESDYDYIIPSEIGLALEIKPKDNLKLFAEYLSRGFGKYEIEVITNDEDLYEDSENGYSFRTGMEFGRSILFRCGLFMQSVPIYECKLFDEFEGYIYDETPQTEMGYTTGFGIKMITNLTIDLYGSYSFLNYDEKYLDYNDYNVSKDYSYKRFKVGLSTGYIF